MKYTIAIDADSLAYKACYRHKINDDEVKLELAYFEFIGEIKKILNALWIKDDGNYGIAQYSHGDTVDPIIVFSPRKSFRNKISPTGVTFKETPKGTKDMGYKASRPIKTVVPGIRDLKLLVSERLKEWVMIVPDLEADDVVNYLAREKGHLISAIDKDVINANPTYSYNFNKEQWVNGRTQEQIEQWYLFQCLMGDTTDNVAGAPGIGEKTAREIIYNDLNGEGTFEDIIQYFPDEMEARKNYWLVRMDQFNGKEVRLWGT